jgi:hypothetical protein
MEKNITIRIGIHAASSASSRTVFGTLPLITPKKKRTEISREEPMSNNEGLSWQYSIVAT